MINKLNVAPTGPISVSGTIRSTKEERKAILDHLELISESLAKNASEKETLIAELKAKYASIKSGNHHAG